MKEINGVKWYTRNEISEMLKINKNSLVCIKSKLGIEEKRIDVEYQNMRNQNMKTIRSILHISETHIDAIKKESLLSCHIPPQGKKYAKQNISIMINGNKIKMMTVKNVAEHAELTEKIVNEALLNGEIVNTKIANEPCFNRCDIDTYMKTSDYRKRHNNFIAEKNRRKILHEKNKEIREQAELDRAMDKMPKLDDNDSEERETLNKIHDELKLTNNYLVSMLRILKDLV